MVKMVLQALATSVDESPLPLRLLVESAAAVFSAFLVAPAISIVDKAIVSNASGLEPLVPSALKGLKTLFTRPLYFLQQPSFLFIWGVYGGTYIVANSIEAICERNNYNPFYPKFFGGSVSNVGLSIVKDIAFAKMFGTGEAKAVSALSMSLFGLRDSMTILASFSLPGTLSTMMQEKFDMTKAKADTIAQLVLPVSMQILSTPFHLLGLDLYNRNVATSPERIAFIQQEYTKTVAARMARILPAFGIGGVVNKAVRKNGKEYLKTLAKKKVADPVKK